MTENGESTATMPTNQEILASPLRRSASIAKLTDAMAKANLEFGEITKDTENPFYHSTYSDLATLIKATRPAMAKHGLVIMQWPLVTENRAGVTTLLSHTSGEWVESDYTLKMTKNDAQGAGSAITYSRRYAYQGALNVAGEEDDDGNAAVGKHKGQVSAKVEEYETAFDQRAAGEQTLAVFQQDGIKELAQTHGKTDAQLIAWMKVNCNVDRIEKVLRRDFDKMKAFVLGKEPLQDTLHSSVEAHRSDSKPVNGGSGRRISEAQLKRLHAIRNKKGIPEQDVKQYVFELKGPESLTDLDPAMYTVVCAWMESVQ